ncbi:hypothetical protein ACWD5R_05200 [Streptomyces sp. NPDC002514]|uniref:hypothetical protein n=1 Tax=Streptomyces sp. NPDC001270 TaxID=3364554 RepID=UPI003673BDE2
MKRRPVPEGASEPSAATWIATFSDRPRSADPTLCFCADVRATWRRRDDTDIPTDPYAAGRLIRAVIDEAAADCDVLRPDAAEQDIGTALAKALPIGGAGVIVVDATVSIDVDESTRRAALAAEHLQQNHRRQEELLRRELELDELARRQAKAREEFLQDHILANPATARLYSALEGSARNWPRLGGPPAGTDLEDLVRTVRQWQPGQQWVVVAQVIHDFVGKLTPEGCKELLVLLAGTVRAFGDEDAARALTAIAGDFQ